MSSTWLRIKGRKKKEKREQPKQKTKRKSIMDSQNPRTNGKSKAIQTESHKEAYTYTLTKREKRSSMVERSRINEELEDISNHTGCNFYYVNSGKSLNA